MAHLPEHILERQWPHTGQTPRQVRRASLPRRVEVPPSLSLGKFATAFLLMFFIVGAMGALLYAPHENLRSRTSSSDLGPAYVIERKLLQLRDSDPQQERQLHTSAGHLYRDLGRYGEAAQHYGTVHTLAPKDSGEAVDALVARGSMWLRQGRLEDARRDLEEVVALATQHSVGGCQVAALRALGNVRREMGHLDAALELYSRSRSTAEAEGTSALGLPALEADIGEAHARRGDLGQAESHFLLALQQEEELAGRSGQDPSAGEEPEFGVSLSSLGNVYHGQGDVRRAVDLYRQALRIQERALRPDHPDLIATRMSLARALRDSGDVPGAVQAAVAIDRTLQSGSQESPDRSRVLILKSDLLRELGHFPQAEQAIKEAIHWQAVRFGGKDRPEVAVALNTLGGILHDQGQLQLAYQHYRRALNVLERTVGTKHPEVAATRNMMGTLQFDLGDSEAAELHFRKCLEIQLAVMGPGSPELGSTLNNLATLLFRKGSHAEAAALFRQALGVLDAAGVPAANPDRLIYAENLARALKDGEDGEDGKDGKDGKGEKAGAGPHSRRSNAPDSQAAAQVTA